jgi:hypothetical protein
MSSAETRLLHDLGETWTSYGPALRDKFELDGGMTWKTVHGHEYLCRYRPDPETRKKKFTSLGRRSPETEATYNAFIKRREVARQTVLSSRDEIALSGRLVKAHGLARLPAKSADVLRAFWHRSIDEQLTLFGGSALFAYELETEIHCRHQAALDPEVVGATFYRWSEVPVAPMAINCAGSAASKEAPY